VLRNHVGLDTVCSTFYNIRYMCSVSSDQSGAVSIVPVSTTPRFTFRKGSSSAQLETLQVLTAQQSPGAPSPNCAKSGGVLPGCRAPLENLRRRKSARGCA
jgi:hypothetical protein